MPRKTGHMTHEANRAVLSMAGVRIVAQGNAAPGIGAEAAYTVTDARTRRVMISHGGTYGDIRLAYNATAVATDFAVEPALHFVIDAEKDDTISFFNTSAGALTVTCLELL